MAGEEEAKDESKMAGEEEGKDESHAAFDNLVQEGKNLGLSDDELAGYSPSSINFLSELVDKQRQLVDEQRLKKRQLLHHNRWFS